VTVPSNNVWSVEEDQRLRELAIAGRSSFEIAQFLDRTPAAVKRRASSLGVRFGRVGRARPSVSRFG
jgi:hypothetical protein